MLLGLLEHDFNKFKMPFAFRGLCLELKFLGFKPMREPQSEFLVEPLIIIWIKDAVARVPVKREPGVLFLELVQKTRNVVTEYTGGSDQFENVGYFLPASGYHNCKPMENENHVREKLFIKGKWREGNRLTI